MFAFHQFDKGQTPPFAYLPGADGETFSVGEALSLGAGKLTRCAATAVPEYIAMGPTGTGDLVPCTRVAADIIYDAPLTAAGDELTLGSKVTLAEDALGVTATTASGVAKIVRMDGTAIGDTVGVRF